MPIRNTCSSSRICCPRSARSFGCRSRSRTRSPRCPGPAYFFFLVEAMIDAGILLGLPRAVSAELIIQSAVGAAIMLRDSGEHPTMLREAVTSPGGTTIAAIRELEKHAVRAALLSAIEAAAVRSAELGKAHEQG